MRATLARTVLGFLAAAVSVLVVHQGLIAILTEAGIIAGQPWSMTHTIPPYGVPYLVNSVFWGGLWGIVFAFVHPLLPGRAMWLKGLVFGLLIVVFSNWMLLPLVKAHVFGVPGQVLFAGFHPQRMLIGLLINGGYGLGLGVVYGLIARARPA